MSIESERVVKMWSSSLLVWVVFWVNYQGTSKNGFYNTLLTLALLFFTWYLYQWTAWWVPGKSYDAWAFLVSWKVVLMSAPTWAQIWDREGTIKACAFHCPRSIEIQNQSIHKGCLSLDEHPWRQKSSIILVVSFHMAGETTFSQFYSIINKDLGEKD